MSHAKLAPIEDAYIDFNENKYVAKKVPRPWLNFQADAHEALANVTSNVYDGAVSKGLKHGFGQLVYPNGDVYKGNFKNDVRHGSGLCKFPNGCIFKGEWRDNSIHSGIFFCPGGEMIEARLEDWKVSDGLIKILFSNGDYYEGSFKNNCR